MYCMTKEILFSLAILIAYFVPLLPRVYVSSLMLSTENQHSTRLHKICKTTLFRVCKHFEN